MKAYHVSTPEIAATINHQGFTPKQFIKYNYYSTFGKNGIYFYNTLRQSQLYAYFLSNKLKINQVALITCEIPDEVVLSNEKLEDGLFVSNNNLSKIKIINIELIKPGAIY